MSTPDDAPISQTPIFGSPVKSPKHEDTRTPIPSPERPQSPPKNPMLTPEDNPVFEVYDSAEEFGT